MKNLVLSILTVFALVFTSCSSDDDNGGGSTQTEQLTVTIDGTAKTFDTIIVGTDSYTEGGVTYNDKTVTATIGGSASEIIFFELEQGDTGANAIYSFAYTKNGVVYEYNGFFGTGEDLNFSTVVSQNDGTTIAATFSGDLGKWNNDTQMYDVVTLSSGSVIAIE